MKFVCPYFDDIIEFKEHILNTLVIENKNTFRNIVEDLDIQINGFDGKCVLSNNDKPITFSGNCEIISDFAPFDINKKSLINSIINNLDKTAGNEDFFLKTQEIIALLEKHIYDLSFDYPCNIEPSKLSIGSILKSVGIQICNDYTNTAEKIIDYMILVREFDKNRLFITINMRSYFDDKTMNLFVDSILQHKLSVFMIDSNSYPQLRNEKRITIDNDMCVF